MRRQQVLDFRSHGAGFQNAHQRLLRRPANGIDRPASVLPQVQQIPHGIKRTGHTLGLRHGNRGCRIKMHPAPINHQLNAVEVGLQARLHHQCGVHAFLQGVIRLLQ